jgi:hypothetical protein
MPYDTVDKRLFAASTGDSPPCLNITVIVVDVDEAKEPWGRILCNRGGAGMQAQMRGTTTVMVLSFIRTGRAKAVEIEDYLYVVEVVASADVHVTYSK